MPDARLRIEQINAFDQHTFVHHLGFVFEKTPWIAAEAWRARPFGSTAHLHQTLSAVLAAASAQQKIALIRAHPDLAAKAAIAADVTG